MVKEVYEEAHATYQIITGDPDTVIKKLKHAIDLIDPGYASFGGGRVPCPMRWPCAA